ncbi:MAG: carbohydrate ABC transporter permease [Anaerolineae bacterium]|nr:carbohydrate ABC transporter permease [Anaerolineae bacterium]
MIARKLLNSTLFYIALALAILWTAFPIYWMIATSFKSGDMLFNWPPTYFPYPLTLANYEYIFRLQPITKFLTNSAIVAVASTPISVALAALAAFGFSRFRFRGRNLLMFLFLAVRMLPALIIALPLFMMFRSVGLHDSLLGLIIVYTAFNMPFNIWLLQGFFAEVPSEIQDSALIDGCTYWQLFMQVMIPLITPGLVASAIFCLLLAWNEFSFALTLTYTVKSQTLPIAIAGMTNDRGTLFGSMGAVGTVATLPILAFALYVQKYLVQGLTAGAVKG